MSAACLQPDSNQLQCSAAAVGSCLCCTNVEETWRIVSAVVLAARLCPLQRLAPGRWMLLCGASCL